MNECETGVHHCGEGQLCHNLPGSYRCDCKPGFQRDAFGRTCIGMKYWGPGSPGNKERFPVSLQLFGLDPPKWLPSSSSSPLGSDSVFWLSYHLVLLCFCTLHFGCLCFWATSLLAAYSVPAVHCLPGRCERMLGLTGPPVPAHV